MIGCWREGLAAAGEVIGCTTSWYPVLLLAFWAQPCQWEATQVFGMHRCLWDMLCFLQASLSTADDGHSQTEMASATPSNSPTSWDLCHWPTDG